MAIVYRTDGAWGTGKGSNLEPAEVDGNFYDIDQRVTYWEDNPPLPIEPISITITGYNFTMGLSNGETLGPVVMTMPVPEWRGTWTPPGGSCSRPLAGSWWVNGTAHTSSSSTSTARSGSSSRFAGCARTATMAAKRVCWV